MKGDHVEENLRVLSLELLKRDDFMAVMDPAAAKDTQSKR